MIRRTPLKRSTKKPRASPYMHPEWRKLANAVKRRSKTCEAQVACDGNPATGDPHHLSYAPGKGWRRLIVPLDQLQAVCYTCHTQLHRGDDV